MTLQYQADKDVYEIPLQYEEDFWDVADRMAARANNLMLLYAPRRTGAGAMGLHAEFDRERRAIVVKSERKYMWYLEFGYKGFVMRNLAGKTIPITLPDGRTIFRKATIENIGKHRISKRDPLTGQILPGNTPYTWQHPGQKPLRFVKRSLDQAREEYLPELRTVVLRKGIQDLFSGGTL